MSTPKADGQVRFANTTFVQLDNKVVTTKTVHGIIKGHCERQGALEVASKWLCVLVVGGYGWNRGKKETRGLSIDFFSLKQSGVDQHVVANLVRRVNSTRVQPSRSLTSI
jgi:hypothetical protein